MSLGPGHEEFKTVDQFREEVRDLRAKGDYYRNILESAAKGVWVVNGEAKTVYINFQMAEMLGYTIGEVTGEDIFEFIDEDHRSQFKSRLAGCNVECHEPFDLKFRRKDGKEIWALAGLRPFYDKAGNNIGVNGSFVDITERKLMEMALKETRDNLEKAQRIGKIGSWVRYCKTGRIEFSEELCNILGIQKTLMSMEGIVGLIHNDDREIFQRTALFCLGNEGRYKTDVRMNRSDGQIVYCYIEASLTRDKDGRPEMVVGIIQDITERKLAEAARLKLLYELKERVKELTALYCISNIVQASRNADEVLYEVALTLPPAWQYPEITVSRITFDGMSVNTPGFHETPWAQRADFTTAAGKKGAIEVYYTEEKPPKVEGPFLAEERRLINSLADIIKTYLEHRQAEEALRESEEKFRTLAETAPFSIFFHCGDSFIYANPAALKIVDNSIDNISKMKFWDLFDGEYRELVKERGLARLRGEDPPSRYDAKLKTGEGEKWLNITSSRVKYKGRTAILTVGMDVTQSKNTEIALREAKANAEFFIDLISHDIANMNQAVLGYLELAQDLLAIDGEKKEFILKPMEIINENSRLIKEVRILRQIWNGGFEIKKIDAGQLLTRAISECMNSNGATINCPAIVDGYVMANEMLGAAFSSIIDNIGEFRAPGKVVDISVARVEENGQYYVKFIFEDNGPGIQDEMKKRLMSDTWEQDGNTVRKSLGPRLAKSLVEAYHGQFWIEDRVSGDYTKGARLVVMLPAVIN